jgi:hypothetical protein
MTSLTVDRLDKEGQLVAGVQSTEGSLRRGEDPGLPVRRVVVEGQPETRDLIVVPGRVVRNWWRRDGHALVLEDLEDVLDELPERLIVGMGASSQMRPDPATLERLSERGIEVECLPTDRAVIRFGELDPARTAVALHLTC